MRCTLDINRKNQSNLLPRTTMDTSTIYLLLGLAGFVLTTLVLVHHHNCAEQVTKTKIAARDLSAELKKRTYQLEVQCKKLQLQINAIDEQLEAITY